MTLTKQLKVVIVGGVAGGASAAARLRRLDEMAEITIFEKGPYVSFANCGLPYQLGGEIDRVDQLLLQTPEKFQQNMRIQVHLHHEVVEIDAVQRQVKVVHSQTGEISYHDYDKLVLATGAQAVIPPLPGVDRPGLFTMRTIPDLENVKSWVEQHKAGRAVVVGAGFIGLEVAEQLSHQKLEVSLIEMAPQVLPPLDVEMANLLLPTLKARGIRLYLEDSVAAFEEPQAGEASAASTVVLKSGTRIPADLIILGVGVRPQVELARKAGLELGERGSLKVDAHLRSSDHNIYAVGDAIEVENPVTGERGMIALAGPANRQGRIVADHIAGLPSVYRGTIGTSIVRVFDRVAACTGASEKSLQRLKISYQALHLHPNSHAGYYPGAQVMSMKVVFCPTTGRLLGAQIVGGEGVDKRIDVLATAIKAKMTMDEVADLELAYAPPFGSAKDPVNFAGMAAQNVLAGLVDTVQWRAFLEPIPEDVVVLDVREEQERRGGAIPAPTVIHIPLGQLRQRLDELGRDREYWVHCASGLRSYNACRILTQYGYNCKNLSGSYRTWVAAAPGP